MTALCIKSVTAYKTEVCAGRTLFGLFSLFYYKKLFLKKFENFLWKNPIKTHLDLSILNGTSIFHNNQEGKILWTARMI